MFNFKSKQRLGIDLGTANSVVYVQGEGIKIKEPTVVAIDISDLSIVAIGSEAKYMLGKTPDRIVVKRPLKSGVIASAKVTKELLRYFIYKALGRIRFFKPEVMISSPYGITSVEKRAVIKAALEAGASKVYLIPEPLAAAIGAKLPIHSSSGNMIINLGGGTAEVAVISLNSIVTATSIRIAGDAFNKAIASYTRRKYNLIIGEQMAEKVKIEIGSALKIDNPLTMQVSGRHIGSGLPTIINMDSNDVAQALEAPLTSIIIEIKKLLERTPPELAADIVDRGITLSGGTALLKNLDKLLVKALGVPVYLADNPLYCVAQGTGAALDYIDILSKSLTVA